MNVMMTKYLTVVFAYQKEEAFSEQRDVFFKSMMGSNPETDWKVSAISIEDEITRLEQIEDAVANDDMDAIKAIMDKYQPNGAP